MDAEAAAAVEVRAKLLTGHDGTVATGVRPGYEAARQILVKKG